MDCGECRERYARLKEEPECEQCAPPPRLEPANLPAWELWQLVADQVRPAGRAWALDMTAVAAVMERLGLGGDDPEERAEIMVRVKIAHRAVVGERR